jgi:hypothetical protein
LCPGGLPNVVNLTPTIAGPNQPIPNATEKEV